MDPKGAAASDSFAVTRWSVVLHAGRAESPQWRESMSVLFLAYWKPLYAFCRRRGVTPDQAHDLLQGFFTHLIERQSLRHAERSRGRFRTFLLACFQHFISDQKQREGAAKRGGGKHPISLDVSEAEAILIKAPVDTLTPERAFERRWALTVLDDAMAVLRE